MQYRKLIMSIKFEFNGEVINISKLSKYFSALDEDLRKKAYDNLEWKFSLMWTIIKCGFMLMMIIAMISSWF